MFTLDVTWFDLEKSPETALKFTPRDDNERDFRIGLSFESSTPIAEAEARNQLKRLVLKSNLSWIRPFGNDWVFDLDRIRDLFPQLTTEFWLHGLFHNKEAYIRIEPFNIEGAPETYPHGFVFVFRPEFVLASALRARIPPEMSESLKRFRHDHPNPLKREVAPFV